MSGLLTGIGFLVIGASQFAHTGNLISTLQDRLLAQGASVVTYGACASVPKSWLAPQAARCGTAVRIQNGPVQEDHSPTATTWAVSDLIHQYHPQIVIVGIADTLAGYSAAQVDTGWVKEQVRALVDKITAEGVRCIWLGTSWGEEGGPLGKTFAKVKVASDLLSTLVSPCEYVDSLKMETPGQWPTMDGQHHTPVGYRLWADAASKAIMETNAVKSLEQPGAAKP
jgi:hypothetical protein